MVERLGFYSTLLYAPFQFGNENRYGSPRPACEYKRDGTANVFFGVAA
jgi:hypothetical protein